MAIIPWNPSSAGAGGGDVSGDYKFTQNEQGELVLNYKNNPVAMMSPSGSWFNESVSTGVGSLHLGGNESGGVAHSISSAGQNVGFKNEFSATSADDKLFFYPPWQAVSCDGIKRVAPTYREYGARSTTVTPNGARALTGEVFYNFALTGSSNSEIYQVTVFPTEVYSGKIRNLIISNVTGAEIYDATVAVTTAVDVALVIKYKYPFTLRTGDALQLRLVKENGSYLKVRAGTANASIPFRQLVSAPFADRAVVAPAIGDVKHSYQTADHDGWVYLNGRSVNTLTASQRANLVAAGINWTNLPATQDRVVISSGANFGLGSTGGSLTIARSALPNFTLTGNTDDRNTDHTHGVGSLTVPSGGAHGHTYSFANASSRTLSSGGSYGFNELGGYTTTTVAGEGNHTHTITGSTATANSNTTHNHPYTTQSINGGVTQTWHTQPYVSLAHFVYIGL